MGQTTEPHTRRTPTESQAKGHRHTANNKTALGLAEQSWLGRPAGHIIERQLSAERRLCTWASRWQLPLCVAPTVKARTSRPAPATQWNAGHQAMAPCSRNAILMWCERLGGGVMRITRPPTPATSGGDKQTPAKHTPVGSQWKEHTLRNRRADSRIWEPHTGHRLTSTHDRWRRLYVTPHKLPRRHTATNCPTAYPGIQGCPVAGHACPASNGRRYVKGHTGGIAPSTDVFPSNMSVPNTKPQVTTVAMSTSQVNDKVRTRAKSGNCPDDIAYDFALRLALAQASHDQHRSSGSAQEIDRQRMPDKHPPSTPKITCNTTLNPWRTTIRPRSATSWQGMVAGQSGPPPHRVQTREHTNASTAERHPRLAECAGNRLREQPLLALQPVSRRMLATTAIEDPEQLRSSQCECLPLVRSHSETTGRPTYAYRSTNVTECPANTHNDKRQCIER